MKRFLFGPKENSGKILISHIANAVLGSLIGLSLLYGLSVYEFGSASAGIAWLRDEPLILSPETLSFKTAEPGEVLSLSFSIENVSGRPIRLLGCHTSCTCLIAEDFPFTLSEKSSRKINFKLSLGSEYDEGGLFEQKMTFYTDYEPQRELRTSVTGQVVAKNDSQ